MHPLKRYPKGVRRIVAEQRRAVDDLAALLEQGRGQRQPAASDVLAQRHSRQIGEHPAKMIFGASGDLGHALVVDLVRQIRLQVFHRPIHLCQGVHVVSPQVRLQSIKDNVRFPAISVADFDGLLRLR